MSSSNNTPPPPQPPFDDDGFSNPFANDSTSGGQSFDSSVPAVAAAPSRVFIVLGLIIAAITFLAFNLFVLEDKPQVEEKKDDMEIASEAEAPDIPDLSADITPPPPPTFIPPEIPTGETPVIDPKDDGPTNELLRQRLRSGMVVSGGAGGGLLPDVGGDEDEITDGNLAFANGIYKSNTKANKVTATHIGNLRAIVAEGKIIHAVLETAINTDLPGPIRAIVSRDIFPEAGDFRIIPKGSRLIGTYNASILGGQKRVYAVWTRLIRPDGVDIMINSPLVDQIGQAGVSGQVDTRFLEIFSRALLTSVVTISVALAADEINGNETTTTTNNTNGTTSSSGSATSQATIDASKTLGGVAEGYLRRFINVQPTILVDQGTPVNVFVNRDLIFPSQFAGTGFID